MYKRQVVGVITINILSNFLIREVCVIQTGRQGTGTNRGSRTNMQAIALQATVTFGINGSCSSLILKVLSFSEELHNFKVVVAADEDQMTIFVELTTVARQNITSRFVYTILRQFITNSE